MYYLEKDNKYLLSIYKYTFKNKSKAIWTISFERASFFSSKEELERIARKYGGEIKLRDNK